MYARPADTPVVARVPASVVCADIPAGIVRYSETAHFATDTRDVQLSERTPYRKQSLHVPSWARCWRCGGASIDSPGVSRAHERMHNNIHHS